MPLPDAGDDEAASAVLAAAAAAGVATWGDGGPALAHRGASSARSRATARIELRLGCGVLLRAL